MYYHSAFPDPLFWTAGRMMLRKGFALFEEFHIRADRTSIFNAIEMQSWLSSRSDSAWVV